MKLCFGWRISLKTTQNRGKKIKCGPDRVNLNYLRKVHSAWLDINECFARVSLIHPQIGYGNAGLDMGLASHPNYECGWM